MYPSLLDSRVYLPFHAVYGLIVSANRSNGDLSINLGQTKVAVSKYVMPTVKLRGGKPHPAAVSLDFQAITVWAAGTGEFQFIEKTMNANIYRAAF